MAGQAAFGFHRCMFKHERSSGLCVALCADRILIGGGPDIVVAKGSVNVMAVAALHKPLIYLVMERRGKCRLDICVALIAKQGLGYLK
jgi:hypothetical protein